MKFLVSLCNAVLSVSSTCCSLSVLTSFIFNNNCSNFVIENCYNFIYKYIIILENHLNRSKKLDNLSAMSV